ncbi:MAG: FHA domain-containing protein [Planctomycetes bacterium]|nr:FHA domain-containing protein [Planctomycetota bacterium]
MQVTLFLLKKDGSTAAFSLPSSVTMVGRRQDCDLSIPLSVISRKHCEIDIDQNKLTVRDLHSKNGTYVNGQRVEEYRLSPGDQLRLGSVTFVVQIDGIPAEIAGIKPIHPMAVPPENKADKPKQEEHFEEFAGKVNDAQLGSSHTAEIPDIIADDLNSQGA